MTLTCKIQGSVGHEVTSPFLFRSILITLAKCGPTEHDIWTPHRYVLYARKEAAKPTAAAGLVVSGGHQSAARGCVQD